MRLWHLRVVVARVLEIYDDLTGHLVGLEGHDVGSRARNRGSGSLKDGDCGQTRTSQSPVARIPWILSS